MGGRHFKAGDLRQAGFELIWIIAEERTDQFVALFCGSEEASGADVFLA